MGLQRELSIDLADVTRVDVEGLIDRRLVVSLGTEEYAFQVPKPLERAQEIKELMLGLEGDSDPIVVRSSDGIERRFARDQVADILPLINGRFYRTDPVRTRFFIAPTARTLGGGEFRGDLTYFYPSVTAGLSDRVDLLASGFVTIGEGAVATPLIGLKGQLLSTETAQIAGGVSALFAFGDGTDGAFVGVPYVVGTFGDETQAVTVGVGGFFGGGIHLGFHLELRRLLSFHLLPS